MGFDPDCQSVVDASMRSDDHEDGHDAEGHTDVNGIGDQDGLAEQMDRAGRCPWGAFIHAQAVCGA